MLLKSLKSLAIAAIFCFAIVHSKASNVVFSAEKPSTIAWGNDLNEALRQAAQTGQPVLVHFYSNNCVPCKMLDAKAFKSQMLGDAMARTVLPVKINYDQHRDIAQRYQITRFPTDLFLHPNGEELYRTVSPQDPNDYTKLLDRVAVKNRDWVVERMSKLSTVTPTTRSFSPSNFKTASVREERPVATQGSLFQSPSMAAPADVEPQPNSYCTATECANVPPIVAADSVSSSDGLFQLASQTTEIRENRYQRQSSKEPSLSGLSSPQASLLNSRDELAASPPMASVTMGGVFAEDSTLGLDGYCPVSLVGMKAWSIGDESYSVKHRGRIYRCVNEDARVQFLQDPDRYSPVLSGYDIVHFLETGELVAGKREHGCEYLGRVFVFMNDANKTHFDTHATHYAQNIHAINGTDRIAHGANPSLMQR